mmetsp:Transcript_33785/g.52618  ORF Transcript_33785/g.52618 Transcript_33785/m.52618 type:complete len:359 (+) Transcript_33785:323-1399(+)
MDQGFKAMFSWLPVSKQKAEPSRKQQPSSHLVSAEFVMAGDSTPGRHIGGSHGNYPMAQPSEFERVRSAPQPPSYRVLPSVSSTASRTGFGRTGSTGSAGGSKDWDHKPAQAARESVCQGPSQVYSPVAPLWSEKGPEAPPRPSLQLLDDELSEKSTPRDPSVVLSRDGSPKQSDYLLGRREHGFSGLPETILSVSDEGSTVEVERIELPGHNLSLQTVYSFQGGEPCQNPSTTPVSTPASSPTGSDEEIGADFLWDASLTSWTRHSDEDCFTVAAVPNQPAGVAAPPKKPQASAVMSAVDLVESPSPAVAPVYGARYLKMGWAKAGMSTRYEGFLKVMKSKPLVQNIKKQTHGAVLM